MSESITIKISVGVPVVGAPSVYQCRVVRKDSLGEVERPMCALDRAAIIKALLDFAAFLNE